jgi:hypothetical protein
MPYILAKGTIPREIIIVSEPTKINTACVKGKIWIIHDSGMSVKAPARVLDRSNHKIP